MYEKMKMGIEFTFSKIRSAPTTIESTAKINIIVFTTSKKTRDVIDIFLLAAGLTLNISIILVIASSKSAHTSTNCYVLSLICANLVLLLDAFDHVCSDFDVNIQTNLDYLLHVTFVASILTLAIFSIERYVAHHDKHLPASKYFFRASRTGINLLLIWIMAILITAMELHLHAPFEEVVMSHIYLATTITFLVLPTVIIALLHSLILYEMTILKAIEGFWRTDDLENYRVMVGLSIGFFLTVVPYRVMKAVIALTSTGACCTNYVLEILYLTVKTSSVVLPVIFIALSNEFQKALKTSLCYFCRRGPLPSPA